MDDYIKREVAIQEFEDTDYDVVQQYGDDGFSFSTVVRVLHEVPAADVVSWEWLKIYANGKRVNFTSDFVAEAEREYKGEHQ